MARHVETGVKRPRAKDFEGLLASFDTVLFKGIKSQTKKGDRMSLLGLHAACVERFGTFTYLEIGSHLGGSLQAPIRDPRVTKIVSIDLRPETSPDDRGLDRVIPYEGNSTERMLDNLRALPDADLSKLQTIDSDARHIDPATVEVSPHLCFIDGEHTYDSALADARFCRRVAHQDGTIVFHDAPIVHRAIGDWLRELRRDGVDFVAYPLADRIFVVELGSAGLARTDTMRRLRDATLAAVDRLTGRLMVDSGRDSSAKHRALVRTWLARERWRTFRKRAIDAVTALARPHPS